MPPPKPLDLRSLYHAPPADFVSARAALVKRLRQAGDPRSAEVRALRKPSLSAWAVNQVFAREPGAVAALVDAGERARAAARRATEGGDARPLRDLLTEIRERAERLLRLAISALATDGRPPGEAIVERVRGNLDALAFDPETAPAATRGWLDEDLDPPGFDLLAPLQLAAAGGAAKPRATTVRSRRPAPPVTRIEDRRQQIAEREAREREELLARLRSELAGAEAEAAERRSAAEQAAAAADQAERELAEAGERSARATAAADEARRLLTLAEAAAERARAELADATEPAL